MANNLGELVLEVRADIADFQAKITTVEKTIRQLSEPIAAPFQKLQTSIGAASLALTAYMGSALNAAVQSEELVSHFRELVVAQTQSVEQGKQAVDQVSKYGTILANSSLFTKGDTVRAMQQLTTMTGDWTKSLKVLAPAADMAAAKGWDLTTATTLLGRAMNGNYLNLSRLGLLTRDEVKNMKGFGDVLDAIQRKFGGMRLAQLDTFYGQMQQFRNRMSSFMSSMGTNWMNNLKPVIEQLNRFAGILYNLDPDTKALISRFLSLAAVFGSLLGGGKAVIALFGRLPIIGELVKPLGMVLAKFGPFGAAIVAFSLLFRDQWNAIVAHLKAAGAWIAEHIQGILAVMTALFIVAIPIMIGVAVNFIQKKWLPLMGKFATESIAAFKACWKIVADGAKIWPILWQGIVSGVQKLPAIWSQVKTGVGTVITAVRNMNLSLASIRTALTAAMGPVGWIILGLGALYLAWRTNFLGIRDLVDRFCNWVKERFQWIVTAIEWVKSKLASASEALKKSITDMNTELGVPANTNWPDSVGAAADKMTEKWEKMRDQYNEFYDSLKSALKSYLEDEREALNQEQEDLKDAEDTRYENQQKEMEAAFTQRNRDLEDQISTEEFLFDQQLANEKQAFEDSRKEIEDDYYDRERILDDGVNAIIEANNAEIAALRGMSREADLERDFVNKSLEIEARQAELDALANRTDPTSVARKRALQAEILKLEADFQRDLTKAAIDARIDELETANQTARDGAEDQKRIWEDEKKDKLDALADTLNKQEVIWAEEKFKFDQHLTSLKRAEDDYQTKTKADAEKFHNDKIAGYDNELARIKYDYDQLTSEASLSSETLRMIQEQDLQKMQALLDAYMPDYLMKAGQLGNALVDALKKSQPAFEQVIGQYMAALERLKNAAASAGAAASTGGGGGGGSGGGGDTTTTTTPTTGTKPYGSSGQQAPSTDVETFKGGRTYWDTTPAPTTTTTTTPKKTTAPVSTTPAGLPSATTNSIINMIDMMTAGAASTFLNQKPSDVLPIAQQNSFDEGGLVPRTMTALVHAGEFVLSLKMLDRVIELLQSIRKLGNMAAGIPLVGSTRSLMPVPNTAIDMGGVTFHFSGPAPSSRRELNDLAEKVSDLIYAKVKRRI